MGNLDIESVKNLLKDAGISIQENPDVPDGFPNVCNQEQSKKSIMTHLNEVYPMERYISEVANNLDGQLPEKITEISDELKEVVPEEMKALIDPVKSERFMVESNLMFVFEYPKKIDEKVGQESLRKLEESTQSFLFRTHENLLLLIPKLIESTEKIYEEITGKQMEQISRGKGCLSILALLLVPLGITSTLIV